MDFLTQKLGIVPYWQIGLLAIAVIALLVFKKARLAITLILVFAYVHFLRAYWPDTTVVSGGVTAQVGLAIGLGIVVAFIVIYLFIIKGE